MHSLQYITQGFNLIFKPKLRLLALGPLIINLIIYLAFGWWLIGQFDGVLGWMTTYIPSWLGFLIPIMWVLFGLTLLVVFGYSFAVLSTIIAAPFYGLLAERVAELERGVIQTEPLTFAVFMTIVRRSVKREFVKLGYFIPRILLTLIASLTIGLIPVIGIAVSLLIFLWSSWSMCVQFIDYPADNQGIDFKQTINCMSQHRSSCLFFGAGLTFLMSVPILNLFAMPAAVAGGTLLWIDRVALD